MTPSRLSRPASVIRFCASWTLCRAASRLFWSIRSWISVMAFSRSVGELAWQRAELPKSSKPQKTTKNSARRDRWKFILSTGSGGCRKFSSLYIADPECRFKISLGINRTWILAALVPFFIYAGLCAGQNATSPDQEQLAKGIAALRAGDLDSAEKVFTQALNQGVKIPLIYHNLGVIAQERGQHEQAVARFRETLRLQPEFGPAHLLLGVNLLALGENAEAARELKTAEKLMPAEPQVHLQLARAYDTLEQHFAAIDQYQQLTRLAPQNAEYVYLLARSWADLSQSSLKKIAKIDSNSARLHQALSLELWNQGKYDQALSSFRKAEDVDPKLPEIHLALAQIYLEQKKYDEALGEIDRELTLVPDSQAALGTRAKIAAAKAASAP